MNDYFATGKYTHSDLFTLLQAHTEIVQRIGAKDVALTNFLITVGYSSPSIEEVVRGIANQYGLSQVSDRCNNPREVPVETSNAFSRTASAGQTYKVSHLHDTDTGILVVSIETATQGNVLGMMPLTLLEGYSIRDVMCTKVHGTLLLSVQMTNDSSGVRGQVLEINYARDDSNATFVKEEEWPQKLPNLCKAYASMR